MIPNIHDGDELLVVPGKRPRFGDVVVFPSDTRLVAHRIIGIGTKLLTAGDASKGAREHVDLQDVIGTVVEITRSGRIVNSHVRSRATALRLRARLALRYHFRVNR